MEYHFCGCVNSDLDKIKYFVDSRINELNRYVFDVEKLFDIRLIVNELVINGALHGNALRKDKSVFLKIDACKDCIRIKVKDEGEGIFFNIEEDYDPTMMLSSGRGLVLVKGLADKLEMEKNMIIAIINNK